MALVCPFDVEAQSVLEGKLLVSEVRTDSSYYIGEWVLEESILVYADGKELPKQAWLYDPIRGLFTFRNTTNVDFSTTSKVEISYRFYPYSLRRSYNDRAVQQLDSSLLNRFDDEFSAINIANNSNGNNESDLQQRGSLSRGIIVGTNQDFALESGLDFELSGKLTEDVIISAILTDRSIPIQPDGTTQNLKEFDKVFIQVQAPSTTIEMGDVDISLEKSTFAKLNRRLQGAAGYNSTRYSNLEAAASVVRGVFKSVNISGLEGVQGPYRLTGNENEEFVIILAGTEKVYINGQLVDRGEEGEYIIDYGLGEIYFTNNQLIKDETRIVVEYEYIDQNFNRTLVAAEGEGKLVDDRLKIGATVIRQADGNNLLSQQTLTESNIDILRQAGDDRNAARVSGAERVDINDEVESNVLYAQIDTVVNGQTFSIYENRPGSEEAVFRVRFSNLGEGQGSYERIGSSVNGLLFGWVGPNEGDYEPFRNLPAPIEQQMAAFKSSFDLNSNIRFFGEWAVSDYDQNRFSDLDDDDNTDHAYLAGIQVDSMRAGSGLFNLKAERRTSGANFQFFERTRDVEFARKWNLTSVNQSEETINDLSAQYDFNSSTFISGEYGFLDRSGFTGTRHGSEFRTENKSGLSLDYNQDWVKSEDDFVGVYGNWFRHQGGISKRLLVSSDEKAITPYLRFEQEDRRQRNQAGDSLTNLSLKFYEVIPGVRYEAQKWLVDYSLGYRNESRPLENSLQQESEAIQHSIQLNINPSSYFNTQNKVTVRSKEIEQDFKSEGKTNKKSLLIRSNTNYSTISENWEGNFLYEVNTQRQALLQETYIEVGAEIGQYVWDDLNSDGVEQLDEFFLELTPNEGTYIRQFLPSDDLFPVIELKVRFRNEIKPFGFLRDSEESVTFLNQIIFRSRFDISENSTTENLEDIYLLNLSTFRDPATTIQGRLAFEKELDVFPAYSKYDLRLRYNQLKSLNRRSSELQTFFNDAFAVDFIYDLSSTTQGSSKYIRGINRTNSNSIANRNFNIYSQSLEQDISSTLSRSWRTSFLVSYSEKEDRISTPSIVTAKIVKVRNTNRFFLWRKVQVNSSLELRNITVDGSANAVGKFELTEGSGEGISMIWSLNSSYRVSNLIRLNLVYDGRTVRERRTIHTAKLTVKAIF